MGPEAAARTGRADTVASGAKAERESLVARAATAVVADPAVEEPAETPEAVGVGAMGLHLALGAQRGNVLAWARGAMAPPGAMADRVTHLAPREALAAAVVRQTARRGMPG